MITIQFSENKPQHYGFTGVHLYASSLNTDSEITIQENDEAITLYKEYYSILILLSNELDPFPGIHNEGNFGTYPIMGNPKHMELLNPIPNDMSEFQLLGYLDQEDIQNVLQFLQEKSLDHKEGISRLYQELSDEVKEQLNMCVGDSIEDILHPYFTDMIQFFTQSIQSKKVVIIISNS